MTVCSANGTLVRQLYAYDDDNDPVSFTLLDDSSGPFSLSSSGLLYVDTSKGWLNYEVRSFYTLTVGAREVSNQAGSSPLLWALQGNSSKNISVVDVRENPYFVNVPFNYTVDEESVFPSLVTPHGNGSYIVVNDEDFSNNSALVVSVVSTTGQGSGYFEVVNGTDGSACRGGHNCVLRMRSGAPRINYDSPSSLRNVSVTLTVTDNTTLFATLPSFNVTVMDINQGTSRRGACVCRTSPVTLSAGVIGFQTAFA